MIGTQPAVPTFSVKPEVVALEELFEEIKSGHLRSPRFQRDFVWKPEDMRRLFESVIRGYPIGSLLIWEPGARYELRSRFGPIEQREFLKARPDDGPRLVERAERLLRLVRVYKIPVVRIRGGRLEDAVDIFSRLNSSGVPMAADQMVSALTYREGFARPALR